MLLVVPKESKAGERRVAATPATLNKLIKLGFEIHIEKDAGLLSLYPDSEYEKNGAKVVSDISSSIRNADVVASVVILNTDLAKNLKPGAICISFAQAKRDKENIKEIINAKATLLSFDFVPRISRAQSADALTSQATVSGYHTMVTAASLLPKMLGATFNSLSTIFFLYFILYFLFFCLLI